MKVKKTLISLAIFLPLISEAQQFNLDETYNPKEGDVYNRFLLDNKASEGTAGANRTWDFSSFQKTSHSTPVSFISKSSGSSHYSFPDANLAEKVEDFTNYYKVGNNEYTLDGFAGYIHQAEAVLPYSDTETFWKYPFIYNTGQSDIFFATATLDYNGIPASFTKKGSVTSKIDSYGTLTLPGKKTFQALRVKVVETYKDSVRFTTNQKEYTDNVKTSYLFFAKNINYPLIVIQYRNETTTTIDDETFQGTVKTVTLYEKNITDINKNLLSQKVKLFPNPIKHYLFLETDPSIKTIGIQLLDKNGRVVMKYVLEQMTPSVNLEGLKAGLYILEITTDQGVIFKKISKE